MEDIGITSLNEVRRREEVDVDEKEGEKRQKLEVKLDEEDGISTPKQGSGVGILDNLLAKLSSPKPTSNPVDLGDFEDFGGGVDAQNPVDPDAERGVSAGGGAGGGVISNMISSFFHRGGEGENLNGHHDGEEEVKGSKNEGVEVVKKDGVGEVSEGKSVNNGGSIISNLVPDDVVPASDEASILIHSVVHD